MLGMGSGQPNRWESLRIAFRNACQNGIGVIAQPGGSMRDDDTVDCCNKYGVSLVVTGVRHFRH
jgi:phosphoribosylaminoimidazolecarboxamide formyltransferase / IMP cyclohydrolase